MRIVGVVGSLREDSYNDRLLRFAGTLLPDDVEFEVYDELETLPPYNADIDDDEGPEPVERLRDVLAVADGILIATPEYNSSIPGVLKNAVDWASRPFPDNCLRSKPVAVIGASTGRFGAVRAQAELRKALATAGAAPLDEELPVGSAGEAFDGDGLADPAQVERLQDILDLLVSRAEQAADAARERERAAR